MEQDLAAFREAVRSRRRATGRTQQELARRVGVHPDVLSHKLHARGAVLTSADVTAIVTVLAGWGAIGSQADPPGQLLLGVPGRPAARPHRLPERRQIPLHGPSPSPPHARAIPQHFCRTFAAPNSWCPHLPRA